MTLTADSVWNECLIFIKDNIKPQAYKTWFEPIKPVKISGEALTIQVPSKFKSFLLRLEMAFYCH